MNLDYDPGVLLVTSVTPTLCPSTDWSLTSTTPFVATACAFQSSTATSGVMETVQFRCIANGTSPLTFEGGEATALFDSEVRVFAMMLQNSSVVCGTGVNEPTPTPTGPTATFTPTATPTGGPGSATMAIVAPASSQAWNLPFIVKMNLTAFSAGSHGAWAGYDALLEFDPSVVQVGYDAPTLCPAAQWTYFVEDSDVVMACFAMDSTSTGTLDSLVFTCVGDGISTLHLVPDGDYTTKMFDVGAVPFPTTLQDATITCDQHVDDDGDGCATSKEPALGLNSSDPWDFYSVPVPSLLAAPNPRLVFKDHVVGAADAQAVFAYFKAGATAGDQRYDQDLNGNGVADGVEYDRSFVGPSQSGAPDGVVSAQDAQLAFAQFRLNYRC
jgi:hypothetical protein